MATYGDGSYQLTAHYRASTRRNYTVTLNERFTALRAFTEQGQPVRKRHTKRITTPKRPTSEWTGITDHALIPATSTQRKEFALTRQERAIKK